MNIEKERQYFNYRIFLKAKSGGFLKSAVKANKNKADDFEAGKFYEKFKACVEHEIDILYKFKIKPVKTSALINRFGNCSFSPSLPQFLHISGPDDLLEDTLFLESLIKPDSGVFLTSSRYDGTKIYKPAEDILRGFNDYFLNLLTGWDDKKFDFICIGTNSETEKEFIKIFPEKLKLIILPAYSLLYPAEKYKAPAECLKISALDPFAKNLKYGLTLRNSLAFHLSKELGVLYLSKKSALSGIIKKFRKEGKSVKIFEGGHNIALNADPDSNPDYDTDKSVCKTCEKYFEYGRIGQFIMSSLEEKENIAIDNLLKLSNIKLNASEKEIINAISILEINSEIERYPGGIIKKYEKSRSRRISV